MIIMLLAHWNAGHPGKAGIHQVHTLVSPGYDWGCVKVGGGGYVTGIVVHPIDKNIMYMRTDVGGAYRWDAGKQQWIQMLNWVGPDEENLIGVDGMAIDPHDPDRIYLALGKNINGDGGIYRSGDRGKTWTRLMTARYEGNGRVARWIGECIAVDPDSGCIIYAGTRRDGLWRSLDDGTTWSRIADIPDSSAAPHPAGVRSIVFDPVIRSGGRSSTVYVGVPGSGIYYSTNGGRSFSLMKDSPKEPARMQVVDRKLFVTHASGVALWSDGSWQDITPRDGAGKNYVGLAVDENNDRRIVVAQRYSSYYNPVYRSTDRGRSWQQINGPAATINIHTGIPWWPQKRFSSATSCMALLPGNSGELYYSDWFGVWHTPNVWDTVTDWNTVEEGHEETVVLTLVAPPAGALVYSGMADNFGFRHTDIDAYPLKRLYNLNEGFSIAVCEQHPEHIAVLGAKSWKGSETSLFTSADYGETWTGRSLPPGAVLGRIAVASADPRYMIYIAGGGKAYYTADYGNNWMPCEGAPEQAVKLSDIWNKDFAIAADPVNNSFYIFKAGILYASTDGGAAWQAQNKTPIPNAAGYLNVVAMPGRQGEVWISLDKNGLWRTADRGNSFTRVAGIGTARLFSWGKAAASSNIPTAYCYGTVGGKWGLYRSVDAGSTWVRINDDEHQFPSGVKAIAADRERFGRVYVGTGGCGIIYGQPHE